MRSSKIPAVVHVDLDGAKHIYRIHGWRYDWRDDPLFESGLRRALDLFDRAQITATLFVIAEDLEDPRKRELLQEAVNRGHEIASHSITHRRLTTLDSADKRREICVSRQRLSESLKADVVGFRAPGFFIDGECLELMANAGYTYDSSLFPDMNSCRKVGVPLIRQRPHRLMAGELLAELPLPGYSTFPMPFHPSYSLIAGLWYFRLGVRWWLRTGAPLVLLFHLTDMADPLPSERLQTWAAKLFTLSHLTAEYKRRQCEHMLTALQENYRIVNTRSLLATTMF